MLPPNDKLRIYVNLMRHGGDWLPVWDKYLASNHKLEAVKKRNECYREFKKLNQSWRLSDFKTISLKVK